ncbi:MAG: hypothetical protein OXE95_07910 [Chloroflexi bacterium]|nr:hypothetical protein [Chloroflexota bacterium]
MIGQASIERQIERHALTRFCAILPAREIGDAQEPGRYGVPCMMVRGNNVADVDEMGNVLTSANKRRLLLPKDEAITVGDQVVFEDRVFNVEAVMYALPLRPYLTVNVVDPLGGV